MGKLHYQLVGVPMAIKIWWLKKLEYYKKLYFNRKYHLEEYIKKFQNYENFERMKVIFYKIVIEILNLKRKRMYKFNLILSKVFGMLNYKIEITIDNKMFNEVYKQIKQNITKMGDHTCNDDTGSLFSNESGVNLLHPNPYKGSKPLDLYSLHQLLYHNHLMYIF